MPLDGEATSPFGLLGRTLGWLVSQIHQALGSCSYDLIELERAEVSSSGGSGRGAASTSPSPTKSTPRGWRTREARASRHVAPPTRS